MRKRTASCHGVSCHGNEAAYFVAVVPESGLPNKEHKVLSLPLGYLLGKMAANNCGSAFELRFGTTWFWNNSTVWTILAKHLVA